jgi:hypothetical protein
MFKFNGKRLANSAGVSLLCKSAKSFKTISNVELPDVVSNVSVQISTSTPQEVVIYIPTFPVAHLPTSSEVLGDEPELSLNFKEGFVARFNL